MRDLAKIGKDLVSVAYASSRGKNNSHASSNLARTLSKVVKRAKPILNSACGHLGSTCQRAKQIVKKCEGNPKAALSSLAASVTSFESTFGKTILEDSLNLVTDAMPGGCLLSGLKHCVDMGNPSPLLNRAKNILGCQLTFLTCGQMLGDQLDSVGCRNGFNAKCAGNVAFTVGTALLGGEEGVGCSFAAGTRVIMANGSAKSIEKIKINDSVKATDPKRGTTVARPVIALHDDLDTDMADVAVTSNGHQYSILHTTQNHPFWDATTTQWTRADKLRPGDRLKSLSGTVVVEKVDTFTQAADRYNLTVDQLHTYYVFAGTMPELVHNCGEDGEVAARNGPLVRQDIIDETVNHADQFVNRTSKKFSASFIEVISTRFR